MKKATRDFTKEKMKKSNYDETKEKMQLEFVRYDQEKMIRKFNLAYDEHYLYLPFVDRNYRIDRQCGKVQGQLPDGSCYEGDFNETMSIFDVLCNGKEDCHLAGTFSTIRSLPGVVYGTTPGVDMFQGALDYYDHRLDELAAACEALGGTEEKEGDTGKGDIAFRIPVFPFLPVILQFWESDEEFPTSLQFLWDRNILDYMHYETTFYVTNHIIGRLNHMCNITRKNPIVQMNIDRT